MNDPLSFLWKCIVGPTREADEKWMIDGRQYYAFKDETDEERIKSMKDSGLRCCAKDNKHEGIQDVRARYTEKEQCKIIIKYCMPCGPGHRVILTLINHSIDGDYDRVIGLFAHCMEPYY